MKGLVRVENGKALIDSRDIANYFGKRHCHILRSIENIESQDRDATSMFYETSYQGGTGKNYKMYLMNRDGFLLLALGFTGKNTIAKRKEILDMFDNVDTLSKQDKKPMESGLVHVENEQIVTDSRSIAEHFGKRHADVLESIENIKTENSVVTSMFYETSYKAGTGKSYKMYLMNRDGFSLLVMGFTGKKALDWKLKYIAAFNDMEKRLKQKIIEERTDSYMITDPVKRAKKWIEEETERQKLRAENKVMLPKAQFYDTVANTESLFSMADVAKTLDMGIGRNKLFAFLRDKGILDKDNHPYQKYVDAGYLRLIENHCKAGDNDVVYKCTYVKQKGIDYIRKILLEERGLNENMG